MSQEIVNDPSPLMVIVGAAQHPRYTEVMDATGSEVNALRPIINLAVQVDDWCNRLISQNDDVFETNPFASEYMVLEELGKWIIERLGEIKDIDEDRLVDSAFSDPDDFPITLGEALAFARTQVTEVTGFQFASPEDTPTYKEPK